MSRGDAPDAHEVQMRAPVGGYAARHHIAQPVEQQGRRWRPLVSADERRHAAAVLGQLVSTELTQLREEADQRTQTQPRRHLLKQPATSTHRLTHLTITITINRFDIYPHAEHLPSKKSRKSIRNFLEWFNNNNKQICNAP